MKKFWIQVVVLLIIIFSALYFTYNTDVINPLVGGINSPQFTTRTLRVNNTEITVEIAESSAERTRGLSGRDSLPVNQGMLFIFPETNIYQLWMKGMSFPLDMIFISEGKVVDILKNVPSPQPGTNDAKLPRYRPVVPVKMLLEVNAGFVDQYGISLGQSVYLVE